jgi:hypothetical protein
MEFILDGLDLRKYFTAITTAADVKNGKPDPEVFLISAEKLQAEPRNCIVFEDAVNGFEAAHRAGMKSVGISTVNSIETIMDLPSVIEAHADFVILNPQDLINRFVPSRTKANKKQERKFMRKYLSLIPVVLCLAFAGCNYTGIPVEYANMCDRANDDKYVEVAGFLDNSGSAMCSSRGKGPTECGIRFKESLTAEPWVFANITKGSGASEIENVEGEGLKIRDDKSEFITKEQKVKITATAMVYDTPPTDANAAKCSLNVKKIEKQ